MKIKKYKVLDHTADIMIEAYGNTLGELFENAAMGMIDQVVEKLVFANVMSCDYVDIDFSGDIENEFRNFLNKIKDWLYGVDVENMCPCKCEWECGGVYIDFKLLDREKTVFSSEIKSVTFHEMKITRGEDGIWKTKVVFDV